jgi:hypothetical protein
MEIQKPETVLVRLNYEVLKELRIHDYDYPFKLKA